MEKVTFQKDESTPSVYLATEYSNHSVKVTTMRHFLTRGEAVHYLVDDLKVISHYGSRLYHMEPGCKPKLVRGYVPKRVKKPMLVAVPKMTPMRRR